MQTNGFNKDTVVILPIPVKGNYLFTIEEALAYIVENDDFWLLGEMVFRNVPIRDAIRGNGIKAVADTLIEYAPDSEKMKSELDKFVSRDMHVADFDIQVLPVTAELTFFGKQINYDQLWDCCEIVQRIGHEASDRERKDDTLYVANLYEPYPCFDEFDYACEKRNFENYVISDHKITEDDLLKMEDDSHGLNYCFAVDSISSEFLPIVSRDGDDRFMYVATSKDNPQITPEELAEMK